MILVCMCKGVTSLNMEKPLDLALAEARNKAGMVGYLLEPNLARHIGRKSSLGHGDKNNLREFLVDYCI